MDQPFENKAASRFESFGKKVDEHLNQAVPRLEEELQKVIALLNDQVIPQLRQGSSQAIRAAAERLRKMADQLDDAPRAGER
jgi:hypothetical protein